MRKGEESGTSMYCWVEGSKTVIFYSQVPTLPFLLPLEGMIPRVAYSSSKEEDAEGRGVPSKTRMRRAFSSHFSVFQRSKAVSSGVCGRWVLCPCMNAIIHQLPNGASATHAISVRRTLRPRSKPTEMYVLGIG